MMAQHKSAMCLSELFMSTSAPIADPCARLATRVVVRLLERLVGRQGRMVFRAALDMKLDAVLAGHLDHFGDIRGTWRSFAIQCREHLDCLAPSSYDLQHLTATRAIADA